MRPGMMIELDTCIGCMACVSACKERWDTGPGAARDWVTTYTHGARGKDLSLTFYPGLCNHCEDHPCTTDCPTGATYMTGGVVVVDPQVCIGCGNCIPQCPYSARSADEQKGIVEKCNFCAPHVARGEQPACVATCLSECRHFGDLDDPNSEVSRMIKKRAAKPLTTAEVKVRPKVYYAPEAPRERILTLGAITKPEATSLTRVWQDVTRPVARFGVPAVAVVAGLGGLAVNLRARRMRQVEADGVPATAEAARDQESLPRHRLGLRLLHWFNLLSWLLLLGSGTALMTAPSFALFGAGPATWISRLAGGQASLMLFHVLWGLLWACLIVPLFLYFKHGGLGALREIRPTADDLRWMMRKPLVMLGLTRRPLPPQDKYNAGQKGFAAWVLLGTTMIIASGLVMTFHLGSPDMIRAAILTHKLAILLTLVGLAAHVTMAALIADERPALRSMITGAIDRGHAEEHCAKWTEREREGK